MNDSCFKLIEFLAKIKNIMPNDIIFNYNYIVFILLK